MQDFIDIQEKVAQIITVGFQQLSWTERQTMIAESMSELDAIFNVQTKAYSKGGRTSTYLQKLACATLVFDLCFNSPKPKILKRV